MKVVGRLHSPMRTQFAQNATAHVPAEVCCAGPEFVAPDSSIDERPQRAPARQVQFPIGRELINIQAAPDLRRKIVKTENAFHGKMTRGDVLQSGIKTESRV